MNEPLPQTRALARDYPPPPWTLWGSALVASFAVRAEAVAPLIPSSLKLVTIPGGLAIGYLAVCKYGPGSTLEYSELIAGILVRHGMRPGPYVTHIAVDSPRSQRGGRDLWHLPKQLWRFEWELEPPQTTVRVWDGVRLVCVLSEAPHAVRLWPLRMSLPFLNPIDDAVALLVGDADGRIARVPWRLQLGPDGPLTAFEPVGPKLTAVVKGRIHVHPLQPLDA